MKNRLKRIVSAFLCLAMVLCMIPAIEKQVDAQTGYDRGYDGGMAGDGVIYAHGVDVSKWQGSGLNFYNFVNAGYDYVILRCGTSYGKDECFEEFYANAKAAGLDVGCYYYSYAQSVAEAQAEAYDMLSWMGDKVFEYPVYLDYEDPTQNNISGSYAAQICYGFMDVLKANGYLVGMYSMASRIEQDWVTSSGIRDTYEGWVAHLTVEVNNTGISSSYYDDLLWKYGSRYGMHQYSFSTYVNGVGPFDSDVAFKDYPAIVKKYGFNGYTSNNWRQNSTGWWYEYDDGSYAIGWAKIDGSWYYFDQNGYMQTGWLYDEDYQAWFYLDSSGAMRTGWVYVDGYYYYMDSSGQMLLGWQLIDGDWCYFNTTDQLPEGAMFTGWHEIDGKQYYFSEVDDGSLGAMVTGWHYDGALWYYFGEDGAMLYGWQQINGAWYHLDETTGAMAASEWVLTDNVWQYVNASGAAIDGAVWDGVYEGKLDIGTDFYATIDLPKQGARAGVDSNENSDTYRNLEVQAVRAEDAEDFTEQLWYFQRRDDGSYRITNAATNQCLDLHGGSVEVGTNVRVWENNDALAQRWFVYQEGDNYGFVSACNVWDMTVLDVTDGLSDEGTNIRIWSYNGSNAQQFMVNKVEIETRLGDVDNNGVIDATDYMRVKAAFLRESELSEDEFRAADVDRNGVIDTTDYIRIKAHFLGDFVIE